MALWQFSQTNVKMPKGQHRLLHSLFLRLFFLLALCELCAFARGILWMGHDCKHLRAIKMRSVEFKWLKSAERFFFPFTQLRMQKYFAQCIHTNRIDNKQTNEKKKKNRKSFQLKPKHWNINALKQWAHTQTQKTIQKQTTTLKIVQEHLKLLNFRHQAQHKHITFHSDELARFLCVCVAFANAKTVSSKWAFNIQQATWDEWISSLFFFSRA